MTLKKIIKNLSNRTDTEEKPDGFKKSNLGYT